MSDAIQAVTSLLSRHQTAVLAVTLDAGVLTVPAGAVPQPTAGTVAPRPASSGQGVTRCGGEVWLPEAGKGGR
ncbi:hypothetical protein Shyd_85940 [Streptomyces hydrogenans]|uniref:Roadblock/LAMTOR2 domain-containing protein n=1 Tax=Streptomyces hydrogenans TaxID=1873719 RepID=A0ABQ3PQC2_9ACTN|nr:hypothetical protein GCM10018784_73820 [Streptomyces hydrogenans]GHI27223.1 hypothetical protein Shyd_85940 [Streptomyces hydrogenans]